MGGSLFRAAAARGALERWSENSVGSLPFPAGGHRGHRRPPALGRALAPGAFVIRKRGKARMRFVVSADGVTERDEQDSVSDPTESSDMPEPMPTGTPTEEPSGVSPPRRAGGATGDVSSPASREPDRPPGRIERATAWGKRSARRAGEVADGARQSHASVEVGFRTAERQRRVAAMVLAGGIAYRIFFWLLALSVVVGGVLGFFDPKAVQTGLENHGVTGWMAAAVADVTGSSDGNEWWLLLVGGWLVLWTGYTCSKALALAHASIWGVTPPRFDGPLRVSLLFSGYTLGFIAAMGAARYVRELDQVGGFVATMLVLSPVRSSRARHSSMASWAS